MSMDGKWNKAGAEKKTVWFHLYVESKMQINKNGELNSGYQVLL
jgi:hypothetical protein